MNYKYQAFMIVAVIFLYLAIAAIALMKVC
jgi:hypothetical protein